MCGIAGILSLEKDVSIPQLKQMTDALAHRGPDGEGQWINQTGQLGLAHRRLAIIDRSEKAAQPFHYLNRYHLVHNGEIYNYIELRNDLKKRGYIFETTSDTEVIAAAYDCYHQNCLQKFDGMFAFAIWDEKEQLLFAARDRFGEKPFYYFENSREFVFASEMKALWEVGVPKKTDDKMLLNYISLGYVQNCDDKDMTFFEKIYSLPPAHFLIATIQNPISIVQPYWNIDKEKKIKISEEDALAELECLLKNSINKRLRADVTIGSSLSGGLDSATIVEQLAAQKNPLATFSAVFPGFEKDESTYINSIVSQFQFPNFQVTPTGDELVRDFEKLCWHQEEPFPSSSIYAQYRVFELAKQQDVTVLLDGQGADEVLAGYHRYLHWYMQELISRNKFAKAVSEKKAFGNNNIPINWGVKNWFAAFLPAHATIQLEKREYQHSIQHPYLNRDFIKSLRGREWEGIHKPIVTKLNDILHFNVMEYGLEEMLRYADRNSMAHGREVRLPFLSHELVSFLFSLPTHFKIGQGYTKLILRKLMDKKLPDAIVWRKDKVGYEPPQATWMQNATLQDYLQEAKRKLVDHHILTPAALNKKIAPKSAHEADNFDWRYLTAAATLL